MKAEIFKYVYEIGQLKRVQRSGWWIAGIDQPESVAEHSFRTAILGFLLAALEGADPYRSMAICLFHDAHEARLNDQHKVGQRYINVKAVESKAAAEQHARLPEPIADTLNELFQAYQENTSQESQIAHDADMLECLVQAHEYQSRGYTEVQDWIDSCQAGLVTQSAKQLAEDILASDPSEWWKDLKFKG